MAKIQISCTVEPEVYERIKLVSVVDRRSLADVVGECVRRALPALEEELQKPRLTPQMLAEIQAGKPIAQVIAPPYEYAVKPQASALNKTDPPLISLKRKAA